MSTLAEIENAVEALPAREQQKLLSFLTRRLNRNGNTRLRMRHGLKAAARPALEGLSSQLSIGTRERVRALVEKRHAANR